MTANQNLKTLVDRLLDYNSPDSQTLEIINNLSKYASQSSEPLMTDNQQNQPLDYFCRAIDPKINNYHQEIKPNQNYSYGYYNREIKSSNSSPNNQNYSYGYYDREIKLSNNSPNKQETIDPPNGYNDWYVYPQWMAYIHLERLKGNL